MASQFDVIIIGSGQSGTPLASTFANEGKRTALIEKSHVGGTCINTGCTPTKTMIASARVAHLARRAQDYGVHTGKQITVNMERIRERKRDVVESFRSSNVNHLESTDNVTLIRGVASFLDDKRIHVDLNDGGTQELTADTIIINTGQRAFTPSIEGLDDVKHYFEADLMEIDEVPEHLIIVGGGYIGLEFGQMFRRFGSEVTIIHRGATLTSHEDPDVANEILKIFREDGINVILNANTTIVKNTDDDKIQAIYMSPDGEMAVVGSHLLIGAGRVPNTDMLNLDNTGIKTDDRGYITVDDKLRTGIPHIYAIGDVKGGPAFTHVSYDDYRILKTNLIEGGDASIKGRILPYTMFIDPQLGRVGLSETQAREKGYNIHVAKMPMSHVARAIETDETRGFMKAVVDADSGQILGAAILGIEGGEIMSMIQIAMMGNLPYTALRDGMFAHPLLAESLNNLFAKIE